MVLEEPRSGEEVAADLGHLAEDVSDVRYIFGKLIQATVDGCDVVAQRGQLVSELVRKFAERCDLFRRHAGRAHGPLLPLCSSFAWRSGRSCGTGSGRRQLIQQPV